MIDLSDDVFQQAVSDMLTGTTPKPRNPPKPRTSPRPTVAATEVIVAKDTRTGKDDDTTDDDVPPTQAHLERPSGTPPTTPIPFF